MISTSSEPYVLVPMLDRSTSGMSAILYSVRDLEVVKILFVTDSGAGAPLARLYLMPKSSFGPATIAVSHWSYLRRNHGIRTSRIMTRGQKNTTRGTTFPNNIAGSWCGEDTVLSDQKLLHPICCSDLGYQLDHLWVVVSSISTDNKEASISALGYGQEGAGDERLAIVGLLKDLDLFPES